MHWLVYTISKFISACSWEAAHIVRCKYWQIIVLLLLPNKTPKGGTNFMLITQEKNRQGQNKKSNNLAFLLCHQELGKHHQQSLQFRKLLTQTQGGECSNVRIFSFYMSTGVAKIMFYPSRFLALLSINSNIWRAIWGLF